MFGIEFFCGRKYGGWRLGSLRFDTEEQARATVAAHAMTERAAELTPIARRVAAVGRVSAAKAA